MVSKEGFDDEGKKVFKKGIYEMYHRFLDIFRHMLPQEAVTPTYLGA